MAFINGYKSINNMALKLKATFTAYRLRRKPHKEHEPLEEPVNGIPYVMIKLYRIAINNTAPYKGQIKELLLKWCEKNEKTLDEIAAAEALDIIIRRRNVKKY